ncbi:MAG: homocysteine S-methyltransferase family protein [Ignavibacteriaceae bacterium]|nr:homocysteine S-methyltransferase family protein [Ignavibacteriaceae bacterium]
MRNLFDAKLKSKPLLIDGAIGSYLQQKGFETDNTLWTAKINQSDPEAVIVIHKEYIEAGADIVTTNTFRTNPSSLNKSGYSYFSSYVTQAVSLAKQSVDNKKIYIAGSNAPAEDCYLKVRTLSNKELQMNHSKHIDLLIDNDVDFVLNETQSHLDEIKIICDHCDKHGIPYVLSLYLDETMHLLSGEKLESIFSFLADSSALAIGINCISPILFSKIIGSISMPDRWGYYLNCGSGQPSDKVIECGIQPDEYLDTVIKSVQYTPSFIGSCCGSSPAHTKKIREYLDGKVNS